MKGLQLPPRYDQISGCSAEFLPSYRERDDHYYAVVIRISSRWRVIVPVNGIQWIIQKREASHAAPWRGVGYVKRRLGIMTVCGRLGVMLDASALALLDALPERPSDYLRTAQFI
jgi:hypothetical protein